MQDWRDIEIEGVIRIDRVVDVFEIHVNFDFPISGLKIKVMETPHGEFFGFPNAAAKDSDGDPDWVSGLGHSAAEALENTLKDFLQTLIDNKTTEWEDLEWAEPQAF